MTEYTVKVAENLTVNTLESVGRRISKATNTEYLFTRAMNTAIIKALKELDGVEVDQPYTFMGYFNMKLGQSGVPLAGFMVVGKKTLICPGFMGCGLVFHVGETTIDVGYEIPGVTLN